ncbi:MAG: hypothetical protein H6R19_1931, partial [Proteobacteria bacterium]|nr:hypothetical protein [Pseudomonadota bacterium]
IESLIQKQLTTTEVARLQLQEEQYTNTMTQWSTSIDILSKQENANTSIVTAQIENLKSNINNNKRIIADGKRAIAASNILKTSTSAPITKVNFVPRSTHLKDASHVADTEADNRAGSIKNVEEANAELAAPAYVRSVMRAALIGSQRRQENTSQTLSEQELAWKSLDKLLKDFLGSLINFELNDKLNIRLANIEGDYCTLLSDGQKILFQLACKLHAQGSKLQDSVILMDEPENHLHPAVLNQVIDDLLKVLGTGQIWIATHSVPLIAHLLAKEPDCLWYADGGEFSRAGRSPEKVLNGLMGGPDGSVAMQSLTQLPGVYAAQRFLGECLTQPSVAGPNTNDPQTKQISEILINHTKNHDKKLRMIDFGAGVGRLLATLTAESGNKTAGQLIDYIAYEPDTSKHANLLREIRNFYPSENDSSTRICSDLHNIKIDSESVNVIVMCNVLHEICPDTWPDYFNENSPLMRSLTSDGYLLVVEDYEIPVGERAHSYGFLLLDEPELRKLFSIQEADYKERRFLRATSNIPQYKNRLSAHLIEKSCVVRFTTNTRREAIRHLNSRMLTQVTTHLSTDSTSSSQGRSYGRSAQLFANSSIWINQHDNQ